MIYLADENANLASSTSADLAHPEQQNTSALVDLVVSESQFVEMKDKHDADKEVKINMKMVGKLVSRKLIVYYIIHHFGL